MKQEPMWRRYVRFWTRDIKADIEDEFDSHLRIRADALEAQGMSPQSAMRQAGREFGDRAASRDQCEQIDRAHVRQQRRADRMTGLGQDIRYAGRVLRRNPGFTVVALLTLALGIGANTAIFSIAHGVIFRPLPYAEPERLVRLWEVSPRGDDRNVVSQGNYLDWRTRLTTLEAAGAHRWPYGVALTGDGEPAQVMVSDVTPSVFPLLGTAPLVGRPFDENDAGGSGTIVLLSHRLWQTRFGGDPDVVGRSIVLDGVGNTVIGVLPPNFDFPVAATEIWRPILDASLDATARRSHNLGVIGRLRPGATLDQLQVEASTLVSGLVLEWPEFMTDWGVNVVPLHADLVAEARPLLLILLAGVALVLLVACTNLANLLLGRALTREREIAVRGAVGAGPGRLLRQLLTESLVLAAGGGLFGILFAAATLRSLVAMAPPDVPLLDEVGLNPSVFAFATVLTVLSSVLFGLAPSLRLARADLQTTIRSAHDRSGGPRGSRLRAVLLGAEVALSLVLLIGAGLLVRSFERLRQVDYGFEAEGLVAVSLDLARARYDGNVAHQTQYAALVERLKSIAGVASVAGTTEPPASGFNITFSFAIEGRPTANPSGREEPEALRVITPGYFRVMGIPLLQGRMFEEQDRAGAPEVVIVNQALARLHWPEGSVVGRRISMTGPEGPWKEIVGVVGDSRMAGAAEEPAPAFYVPHGQKTWPWMSWLTLMVRGRPGQDPLALGPSIRAAINELDRDLPVASIRTVEDLYAESVARWRFAMTLLVLFAGLAVFLGMLGMYAVMSYSVAQRRQEIGIRVALGAGRGQVLAGFLREALRITLVGSVVGLIAAFIVTRVLNRLLYGISPTDPVTFVSAALLLLAVAIIAALIPASRATRIEPISIIREG